jgi:TolB protein
VEIEDDETSEHVVWILGPGRGVQSRLTRPPGDSHHPAWSPDGREIAYSSSRTGKWLSYRRRSDGLGQDVLLHDSPDLLAIYPRNWTPDGGAVLASATERDGRERLWLLPRSGADARPLVSNRPEGDSAPC